MEYFSIEGGHSLNGTIEPQGAKNEALQVISATLLTDQPVVIHNIPAIADVLNLIKLLGNIGVETENLGGNSWKFHAHSPDEEFVDSEDYFDEGRKLRGSVMLMGAMIARWGWGTIPVPGGDKIGRRRLDTHLRGLEKLGAEVLFEKDRQRFYVKAPSLRGNYILQEEASVTGTANLIMAAVLTPGTTTVYNAACEPYIQQLCAMLNRMGANIEGAGSNLVTIEGVNRLNGTEHTILPDMIETGSFIGLAAMTQSDVTIKGAAECPLGLIPHNFKRLGIELYQDGSDIHVPGQDVYEIETYIDGSMMTISDGPWPAFTPDLISIALVVSTQARGNVLIHQKMFESRLFFVDNLLDMGAQIILCDPHRATVMGLERKYQLRPMAMRSPDIRAGVSLLIAALSAAGTSKIYNINQIDRGYQDIDTRLNAIGAKIRRFSE